MKWIIAFTLITLCTLSTWGQGFPSYHIDNPLASLTEVVQHYDRYYQYHDRGKGSGYKQYRRWLNFTSNHLLPDGRIGNYHALNQKAYQQYIKAHPPKDSNQRSTHGGWVQEGPTEYSNALFLNAGLGRVNRITFHPTEPNTLFACTARGGVWKTTDIGNTWSPLTDNLPPGETTGLVIDPSDTDVMYLLTGDGDGKYAGSIGVLKTINGGITWNTTGLTFIDNDNATTHTFNIVMHPANPNTILVASSSGIYRSTNGGTTWSNVQSGYFTDIEFCPSHPDTVYAVSNNFYRSTDGGATFTLDGDSDFPTGFQRIEIAVTPANSSYVYLLFGANNNAVGQYAGVYMSEDFGADFVMQSTSPNILGWSLLGDDQGSQASYDLSLAVDQFDPDVVYVGGVNNWRSTDHGQTWQALSHWALILFWPYVHADAHQMKFLGTKLFVANDGGIYTLETTDGTWTDISSGMCIMQPYNIDVFSNRILVGTQDNGSLRWDVGSSTAGAEMGADGFACMWDPSPPGGTFVPFYVSTQNDLFITNTDGSSFGSIGIPGYGESQYWYLDLNMHPTDHDTIYVGVGDGNDTSDVFRSYNRGGAWTDMNCELGNRDITAIAQSPSDPDIMYVSSSSMIVRTTNIHAATPAWDSLAALPVDDHMHFGRGIQDLSVDPDDPDIIYVCLSRYIAGSKVFRSIDGGNSWQNYTGSLPNVPCYSLQMHDNGVNGVYVGSEIGVFYRNSNMSDWIYFSNDLPLAPVYDMDLDGGRLYAGTFGRGVWSSDLYSTCISGLILTASDPADGQRVFHTTDFITSSQLINAGFGTDIQYNSQSTINLISGFEVKALNNFEAKLEDCPD